MKPRQLLLLDVTEMAGTAVCIAGIDLGSGVQVRLNDPQPTRAQVKRLGLRPSDVIEIEYEPLRRPVAPHVEDARWWPERLKKQRHLDLRAVHEVISAHSFASVVAAFGEPSLAANNRNVGWKPGIGARSLATVRVHRVRTFVEPSTGSQSKNPGVRAMLLDSGGGQYAAAPFQDFVVKTHGEQCDPCTTPARVKHIRTEFDAESTLVRIGLTRGFTRATDETASCWLQVTNIFARERQHFI